MRKFETIDIKKANLIDLHHFILGSIAPRPIAMVSTMDENGKVNLSPFSFFNAFGINPPTLIFSPSLRSRDSTTKHTYDNLLGRKECVINVVNWDIVEQTNLASSDYEKGVNEFEKAGFNQLKSDMIAPPRLAESPVQFECKVREIIPTSDLPGAGNLVICTILKIHYKADILDDHGHIDHDKVRLVGRLGGNQYVKSFGSSVFSVMKPESNKGIGFDQLPKSIRLSKYLNGNEIARIAGLPEFPSLEYIEYQRNSPEFKKIFELFKDEQVNIQKHIHLYAKELIHKGLVKRAFALLLIR